MSILRWTALAVISALWSVAIALTVAVVVIRRHTAATTTVAPIALTVSPTKPARWPRYKASIVRFVKVFAFVCLGFVVAAITSPDGLRAVMEPVNGLVLMVASFAGAIYKYIDWKDISGEAPELVTLSLSPTAPAAPAAPEEGVTK
jgi:hypothetical protein